MRLFRILFSIFVNDRSTLPFAIHSAISFHDRSAYMCAATTVQFFSLRSLHYQVIKSSCKVIKALKSALIQHPIINESNEKWLTSPLSFREQKKIKLDLRMVQMFIHFVVNSLCTTRPNE